MKKNFITEATTNNQPLVPLNENNVQRLLDRHSQNGYIIVSASRTDNVDSNHSNYENETNRINNENFELLKSLITSKGYSYIPLFGGYRENIDTDNPTDTFEASIMILNYDRTGNVGDFNNLIKFGTELCSKFNQECILVKAPNENACWVDRNGNVTQKFQSDVTINDLFQEYFSTLHKTQNVDANQDDRKASRFTYHFECYINPKPSTLVERIKRGTKGEIMLS